MRIDGPSEVTSWGVHGATAAPRRLCSLGDTDTAQWRGYRDGHDQEAATDGVADGPAPALDSRRLRQSDRHYYGDTDHSLHMRQRHHNPTGDPEVRGRPRR